ncbi:hypothetical protein PF0227 [Pyrococcus furiosus DSM 3638]|uniref:Uncharacterized protein n=1 Tax=Pyrococcus furiosus (strain ATCC 43587 / DSM 3638 / JCM 8422 / Vc1) TaxID=186497 RepID=Q8U465_PYRFU|nr:hypothetical protein PF0227 [Pyrococcus furiosus DSM 3638]
MVFAWYKLGEELDEKYGGLLLGSVSFLLLKSQLFPNPKELIPIQEKGNHRKIQLEVFNFRSLH